jgi:hypothetical protein
LKRLDRFNSVLGKDKTAIQRLQHFLNRETVGAIVFCRHDLHASHTGFSRLRNGNFRRLRRDSAF